MAWKRNGEGPFLDELIAVGLQKTEQEIHGIGQALVEAVKPPPGPYAIFHHQAHALERLRDIHCIYKRMTSNRQKLHKLDMKKPLNEREDEDIRLSYELTHELKLDFEALYFFGNTLLDQIIFLANHAAGDKKPDKYDFSATVYDLDAGTYGGKLGFLWDSHREKMLWLRAQVTVYRNKFVTHLERPWQRGFGHTLQGKDFYLDSPSPQGWLDDSALEKEVLALLEVGPQSVRSMSHDDWRKKHSKSLIQMLLEGLPEIEKFHHRKKVIELANKIGFRTPSFQKVMLEICRFGGDVLPEVKDRVIASPKKINLGIPHIHKNNKK